ncbi:hypothetical protein GCM10017710_39390 [Arthrobacter ramosus]
MDVGERSGNVQPVTGRTELGLDADGTYPGRQVRQFVRNSHEFDVKLFVFYAFKHLVVPVKAAMEAIVGTPPQSFAKFSIILPSLSDGPKESQSSAQRYWPG